LPHNKHAFTANAVWADLSHLSHQFTNFTDHLSGSQATKRSDLNDFSKCIPKPAADLDQRPEQPEEGANTENYKVDERLMSVPQE
jgi:hypothetical protein